MNPFFDWAGRMPRIAAGAVRTRRLGMAVLTGATVLAALPALGGSAPPARADEVTVSTDALRTGWDPSEPALTPATVGGSSFGQLFSTPVNGQVYGQPLVAGSTVVAATENDWVYGLNAATGAVNWSLSLGTPWAMGTVCNDLNPNVGVTGSPVYDPSTGTVYLVAATMVNSGPAYNLYGISASTGAITEQVPISGSPTNDSSITFNAAQQWERPGLLLMNGSVYAAFASHCDGTPFNGFVAGVNVSTKATTLWSTETGLTDNEAGIWQGGGGLMSDGPGRIFFISGNGVSPAPGPGTSPPGQLAESVVRLAVQSNGSLVAQDFFSPKNAPTLDSQDLDFGSGGAVGLPFGSSVYPHLVVGAGKYGRIYLLDRDNLGGRDQGPNGSDAALRIVCCFGGLWGHPAVFADTTTLTTGNNTTSNDFLYYVGNKDYLREMKAGVDSHGVPYLHTVATSSFTFGYTSGSPAVTSNGTDPSSAIVWEIGANDSTGAGGTLYAFRAVPATTCTSGSPCKLSPIWSAPIGTASKFAVPATDGGRVYVGTRDGHVLGFGSTSAPALAGAAPANLGQTAVGSTTTSNVTVTASANVTVSGVSASATASADPFTVGPVTETVNGGATQVPVTFPVTLAKGDALHAPVTFKPTVPGGAAGALSFAVQSAPLSSVNVPLSGYGTQTGLSPTASSLTFALIDGAGIPSDVPVGTTDPRTVDITNAGTTPQTVTSVTSSGGPFTATEAPARGTVINPGQSVTVEVTFAPRQAGVASGSFTISGSSGSHATVALSGTAVPALSRFTAAPAAVNFASVPKGHKATVIIDIANTGNQPALVARVDRLHLPFGTRYSVVKGLPVNLGDDLKIRITFTPTRTGTFRDVYRLTWTDPFGTHTVDVPLTGVGAG